MTTRKPTLIEIAADIALLPVRIAIDLLALPVLAVLKARLARRQRGQVEWV